MPERSEPAVGNRMPTVSSRFTNRFGTFVLSVFDVGDGAEHVALTLGDPRSEASPLVRVQSSCLTATAFGAVLCDCRQQLDLAMERIGSAGSGVVLYLAQEGRSHGLRMKVQEFALMDTQGLDTVDAAARLGIAADMRDYTPARVMLDELLGPFHAFDLLTNNPAKIDGLRAAGLNVARRVPHEAVPTPSNRAYLATKKARLGHLLEQV